MVSALVPAHTHSRHTVAGLREPHSLHLTCMFPVPRAVDNACVVSNLAPGGRDCATYAGNISGLAAWIGLIGWAEQLETAIVELAAVVVPGVLSAQAEDGAIMAALNVDLHLTVALAVPFVRAALAAPADYRFVDAAAPFY